MIRLSPVGLFIALAMVAGAAAQTSADTIESRTAKVLATFQAGACDALARAQEMGFETAADFLPVPRDAPPRQSMSERYAESAEAHDQVR